MAEEFSFDWNEFKAPEQVLGEAIGAASMCWAPRPEGAFQSQEASEIVHKLIDWLDKNFQHK